MQIQDCNIMEHLYGCEFGVIDRELNTIFYN
jgi:hypothetical protein